MRFLKLLFGGLAMLAPAVAVWGNVARAQDTPPPSLSLPLKCEPQKTCFIQNYVDLDAGPGVRNYRCRHGGYNGHKGVDIRIASIDTMEAGVDVVTAAGGVIKAVRDGVDDLRILSKEIPAEIKRRECGNGIVVSHEGGWETQYCHMKKGSITVKPGQLIKTGDRLGQVGLSGLTTFPHLHISVRHNGKVIDPFSGATPRRDICMTPSPVAGQPLFDAAVLKAFPYRGAQAFVTGFADRSITLDHLMLHGGRQSEPKQATAPALVFYGLAINLEEGDQLRIRITGPNGRLFDRLTQPMVRPKAQFFLMGGRKRRGKRWSAGTYTGTFSLERAGKTVWERRGQMNMP